MKYAAGSNFIVHTSTLPLESISKWGRTHIPLVICAKLITDRAEENIYSQTNYFNSS